MPLKGYFLLGNEEEAARWVGYAEQLHDAGMRGGSPDGLVTIDILDGIAHIHAEMNCPYHLIAPKGMASGGYEIYYLGYSHRKDAITPAGVDKTFGGSAGDALVGYDIKYISDGIAMKGAMLLADNEQQNWAAAEYDALAYIGNAVIEDVSMSRHGGGTVGGYGASGFALTMSFYFQVVNPLLFTATPHMVDRTLPDAPRYIGYIGYLHRTNTTPIIEYANTTAMTKYTVTNIMVAALEDGKAGADGTTYNLGVDIFAETDTSYTPDILAPANSIATPPLIWNFTNGKSIILCRKRTTGSYWFGGTFGYYCLRIEGNAFTAYGASSAALTTTYSYSTSFAWDSTYYPNSTTTYGVFVSGGSGVFNPWDMYRMDWLLFDFQVNYGDTVATSNSELLTFASRRYCNFYPTNYTNDARLCCFAITTTGITQKAVMLDYYSTNYATGGGGGTPTGDKYWIGRVRAACIGSNTVIVIFERTRHDAGTLEQLGSEHLRMVSTDNGATWGTPTTVTFSGLDTNYELGNIVVVTPTGDADTAVLLASYLAKDISGSDKTYRKASILKSEDGGATWSVGATAAPDLNYTTSAFGSFPNGGIGRLFNFGDHDDGFAPSPHRHLPTFYGTARKICRDLSVDPNL